MGDKIVCVKTYLTRQEAEMAQGKLQSSGIESHIAADDAGRMRPHLTFGYPVRLMVKELDAQAARSLLKEKPRGVWSDDPELRKMQLKRAAQGVLAYPIFCAALSLLSAFIYFKAEDQIIRFVIPGILMLIVLGMMLGWVSAIQCRKKLKELEK